MDHTRAIRDSPCNVKQKHPNQKKAVLSKQFVSFFKFLLKMAVIAAATAVFFHFIMCPVYISGNCMFPSIKDGDLCFVVNNM